MHHNPITIVTGASSGIGQATAVLLAEHGHRVALVARTEPKLQDTFNMALERNPKADLLVIAVDIAEESSAQHIISSVIERWGRLDVLINAAGMAPSRGIHDHDVDLIRRTIEVNAIAAADLVLNAWPHWTAQGSGCLVNISSLSSIDPFPGFLAYGMSKSALDGLTRSVHNEGRELGIRAFTLTLGAVETPMLRSFIDEETLPRHATLDPSQVATRVLDCIEGRLDEECGSQIQFVRS